MNDIFYNHILPILLQSSTKNPQKQHIQTILTLSTLSKATRTTEYQKEYTNVTDFLKQKLTANIDITKPTVIILMRRASGPYLRTLPRDQYTDTPMPHLPRQQKIPRIRSNVISRRLFQPHFNFLLVPLDYSLNGEWLNKDEVKVECKRIDDTGSTIIGVCYLRDNFAPHLVEVSSL